MTETTEACTRGCAILRQHLGEFQTAWHRTYGKDEVEAARADVRQEARG